MSRKRCVVLIFQTSHSNSGRLNRPSVRLSELGQEIELLLDRNSTSLVRAACVRKMMQRQIKSTQDSSKHDKRIHNLREFCILFRHFAGRVSVDFQIFPANVFNFRQLQNLPNISTNKHMFAVLIYF